MAGQREQRLVLPVNLFSQLMKIRKYEDGGRHKFMMKVKMDCCVLIICWYITAKHLYSSSLLVCLPSQTQYQHYLSSLSLASAPSQPPSRVAFVCTGRMGVLDWITTSRTPQCIVLSNISVYDSQSREVVTMFLRKKSS